MRLRIAFLVLLTSLAFTAAGRGRSGAADDSGGADGAALFRAGRYEEALRYYEEAARRSPSAEMVRHNLAHARAARGQELFLQGNVDGAAAMVDRALDILPREPAFHLLRARISFESGRLYEAMHHAENAVDPAGDSALAYEILGDIHYQRGELGSALSFWKQAAADGSSRAEDKIRRTDREREAETDFGRDVSVHFTLQYDEPVPREIARTVLSALERLYDQIGDFVGSYPEGDIPVILYSRVLYREITDSPLWAAGSFDGKIRVPVGGLKDHADVGRILPILAHELAHAFLRATAPRGLPLWFEEGLAGHFEERYGMKAHSPPGPGGTEFPGSFAVLNGNLRSAGGSVSAAYRAARDSVRLLISRSGDWAIRRILEKVGGGVPFEKAVEDETGLSLPRLEGLMRAAP